MQALQFEWNLWFPAGWTFFGIAALLLWLPFPTLNHRVKMRWLLLRYTQPEIKKVLTNWQNYLDLPRSAVGALVLVRFAQEFTADPDVRRELLWLPQAVLVAGMIVQTVRISSPATLLAPLFYAAGITLALPGHLEGGFAVLFGWTFAIGAKDVRSQLPATAAALLLAGFFNQNLNPWLLLNTGLLLIPYSCSLLLGRRLAFATREPGPFRSRTKPRKLLASGHAAA